MQTLKNCLIIIIKKRWWWLDQTDQINVYTERNKQAVHHTHTSTFLFVTGSEKPLKVTDMKMMMEEAGGIEFERRIIFWNLSVCRCWYENCKKYIKVLGIWEKIIEKTEASINRLFLSSDCWLCVLCLVFNSTWKYGS